MKKIIRYLSACTAGLFISLTIYMAKLSLIIIEPVNTARVLCDSCFTAAVLLTGTGCIVWVCNMGYFDGLTYSVRLVFSLTLRRYEEKKLSYHTYRDSKKEKTLPCMFLIITGAGFLAVSVMLLFAV